MLCTEGMYVGWCHTHTHTPQWLHPAPSLLPCMLLPSFPSTLTITLRCVRSSQAQPSASLRQTSTWSLRHPRITRNRCRSRQQYPRSRRCQQQEQQQTARLARRGQQEQQKQTSQRNPSLCRLWGQAGGWTARRAAAAAAARWLRGRRRRQQRRQQRLARAVVQRQAAAAGEEGLLVVPSRALLSAQATGCLISWKWTRLVFGFCLGEGDWG